MSPFNMMEFQDKLGRDRAKELEEFFKRICGDTPEVLDIVHRTSMYRFLSGKAGTGRSKHTDKVPPSDERSQLIIQITLKQYLHDGSLEKEEFDSLMEMAKSKDLENVALLESIIEHKLRPANKAHRKKNNQRLDQAFTEICDQNT